jgi:cysteine desulfurase/selenocysteine lyase
MIAQELLPPSLRDDFPLLSRRHESGRPLIYLDSAATALKPRVVIDAVADVMAQHTANVHRSVHLLGDEATELFEGARRKVARLIGAEAHELVLLRNTTEALNLVARCYPRRGRLLVSLAEHHSNLLPWGAEGVTRVPARPDGGVDEEAVLTELGRGGVGVVAVSHVSNVAGSRTDARRLADAAHAAGAILVLDGAQSVPHMPIDVQELDCDFLAFSSHKMCGPTGAGALYGKAERLAELDWYLRGGGTVEQVRGGAPTAKQSPWRFEAGTPAIEAVVGFGAAADYLQLIDLERIETHNRRLRVLARQRLEGLPGVSVVGPRAADLSGPLTFTVANTPSHLIARGLSDGYGICVRSGFHCAEPLHEQIQSPATVRLSFYLYNQPWELDALFEALEAILAFGRRPAGVRL